MLEFSLESVSSGPLMVKLDSMEMLTSGACVEGFITVRVFEVNFELSLIVVGVRRLVLSTVMQSEASGSLTERAVIAWILYVWKDS